MNRIKALHLLYLTFAALSIVPTAGLLAQTWTAKGPVPRSEHSAVFDSATKRMIVFGGLPDSYVTQSDLNDVFWLQNASAVNRYLSWVPVNPTGVKPAPRIGHTAVYDSTNSRMIVFGGGIGRSSPCENDVWVLSDANGVAGTPSWAHITAAGSAPAPRLVHTAVYDPNTNRMMIFGGNGCFSGNFNDVWVLSNANGLGGTPTWTQLAPASTPPSPRDNASAVYDPTNNIMIVFGGAHTAEVWVLSNANGQGGTPAWTQLTPSPGPAARSAHSAVYDSVNNRMTIFGGNNTLGVLFNDVWVLSNTNGVGGTPVWTQLAPAGAIPPAPRAAHTAVYDPASNVMTIFGGTIDSLEIPISDVFTLQHANGL